MNTTDPAEVARVATLVLLRATKDEIGRVVWNDLRMAAANIYGSPKFENVRDRLRSLDPLDHRYRFVALVQATFRMRLEPLTVPFCTYAPATIAPALIQTRLASVCPEWAPIMADLGAWSPVAMRACCQAVLREGRTGAHIDGIGRIAASRIVQAQNNGRGDLGLEGLPYVLARTAASLREMQAEGLAPLDPMLAQRVRPLLEPE
ncbi:MAG: hypothetical protein IPK82_23345 [Polyangiaceae bacterium]|nr:hypothetical protein [Polyangiaceae bacterium]